ncbi:hypothetical protein ACFVH6_22105 [Spirillospora sp. NPDC127200]
MTDTTRRVNVTLTIPTDNPATDVLADITRAVTRTGLPIENTHVYAFTLNGHGDPEPVVHLVIDHAGGAVNAFPDQPERADEYARNTGGLVVEVPVIADHRNPEPTPDERLNDLAAEGFAVTPADGSDQ